MVNSYQGERARARARERVREREERGERGERGERERERERERALLPKPYGNVTPAHTHKLIPATADF